MRSTYATASITITTHVCNLSQRGPLLCCLPVAMAACRLPLDGDPLADVVLDVAGGGDASDGGGGGGARHHEDGPRQRQGQGRRRGGHSCKENSAATGLGTNFARAVPRFRQNRKSMRKFLRKQTWFTLKIRQLAQVARALFESRQGRLKFASLTKIWTKCDSTKRKKDAVIEMERFFHPNSFSFSPFVCCLVPPAFKRCLRDHWSSPTNHTHGREQNREKNSNATSGLLEREGKKCGMA